MSDTSCAKGLRAKRSHSTEQPGLACMSILLKVQVLRLSFVCQRVFDSWSSRKISDKELLKSPTNSKTRSKSEAVIVKLKDKAPSLVGYRVRK